MSKDDGSSELGGPGPELEVKEPDLLEVIAAMQNRLGSAIRDIELGARALRIASASDPKLSHGLEEADRLQRAQEALQGLLDMATHAVKSPATLLKGVGEAALNRVPLPRKETE